MFAAVIFCNYGPERQSWVNAHKFFSEIKSLSQTRVSQKPRKGLFVTFKINYIYPKYIRNINYFILTPHNCCDHCWIKTSVYCSFQNVTSDSASTKVISPSGHNICTFRQGLANNLQSAKRANGLTDEQLNLYYFITTICLKKK